MFIPRTAFSDAECFQPVDDTPDVSLEVGRRIFKYSFELLDGIRACDSRASISGGVSLIDMQWGRNRYVQVDITDCNANGRFVPGK